MLRVIKSSVGGELEVGLAHTLQLMTGWQMDQVAKYAVEMELMRQQKKMKNINIIMVPSGHGS